MNLFLKAILIGFSTVIPHITFLSIAFAADSYTDVLQTKEKNQLGKRIAQTTDDNRDRFLQPDLKPLPSQPSETEPILPPPSDSPVIPPPETQEDSIVIPVTKIEITPSTVFTPEELQEIVQPLEGRSVTLKELKEVAQKITRKYLELGYITSRAMIPEQEIRDGIVKIRIIEGSIAEIQIEGNNNLRDSYFRKRLEQGTDTPVRVDSVEGQLQLLRANSLVDNIEASLQPAAGEGQSSLVVEVDEANPFLISLNSDNYENVTTGAERIGTTLGYLNLTGNGDSFIASFNKSLDAESWSLDFNYSLPVNAKDGTLQLRTNIERNKFAEEIIDRFNKDQPRDVFDTIEGDSELYEVSFRQPLIRNLRKEFALSLGFSVENSRNFSTFLGFEPQESDDITSVIKFGQDYTSRDTQGLWGLRSQFNLGIDAFGATVSDMEDDQDGIFFSWLGQIQRLQRFSDNNLLIIQAEIQLTPDNLLSSEQFTIGGAQSVRGYRNNARLGDNGFRFSIEDRITLAKRKDNSPLFQIAPFADLGVVWDNEERPRSPDEEFLAGIGIGLILQPISGLNIRLDYAPPLVDIDKTSDNIQEDGFYFSVNFRN